MLRIGWLQGKFSKVVGPWSSVVHTEGSQSSNQRPQKKTSLPTVPCGGPRMNRRKTCGNPPRPFRRLRLAEHGTPDLKSSRAPVHSGVGSKIGDHHHQPCRPAFSFGC